MDPREVITDKDVYRVGDTIKVWVKCICAVVDTGNVDIHIYKSSNRTMWQRIENKTTILSCPLGGGYVDVEFSPVLVTQDMVGTLYIGVCNNWIPFTCGDTINSASDPTKIVSSKMVTIKNNYPVGYGGLTVITNPGTAFLDIDGEPQGTTPVYDVELPAGAHSIRVYKSGYQTIEKTEFVTAGSQSIKNYTMYPDCTGWWCPYVDSLPWIIGGAAGVTAIILIALARKKKMERERR